MKTPVSKKGKRNRLIAVSLLLLIIGFGSSRVWQKVTGKEVLKISKSSADSTKESTKPTTTNAQIDVPLINQLDEPSLFNGCEITSLAMMLNYADSQVTKNELAEAIPKVDYLDADGHYGNPNEGFVGDIYGIDIGYSVYHKPIYELAKQYATDKQVVDLTGEKFSQILQQLTAGNPVWVITTVPMSATKDMETWQTANGTVDISWNVHSVLITGFSPSSVYVNDPYGEKNKEVDRDDFEAAWTQMGSQAIVVQ